MPYKRRDSRYVQIRVGGVRQSSGTEDEEAAGRLEDQLNRDLWLERHFDVKKPRSWKEVCVRWAKEKSGKATWNFDLRAIAFWGKHFENLSDVRRINRERVDEICHGEWRITKDPSPVNNTADHYIAVLASMLNAACREWDWIERSPKLRRYPIPEGRDRWLTVSEWFALETELVTHLKAPAKFSIATGMRMSKVFHLEWPQIDMGNKSLTFKGTPNKRGNTIPLNETAMSVLREIKATGISRVFLLDGRPMQNYNDAWYSAMRRASIEGFCWHGLRHTWNSWLAQRGVPKEIRQRLGGWALPRNDAADRYTHLGLGALRPFAAVLDTVLARSEDKVVASA